MVERVPVRSLKQQLAAGIGRLNQVVGQHLFLGRKPGPDLAAGRSTLHADGFRQRQRLDISSLAVSVGNTSENKRQCQKHRRCASLFSYTGTTHCEVKEMPRLSRNAALAALVGFDVTRLRPDRQWIGLGTCHALAPSAFTLHELCKSSAINPSSSAVAGEHGQFMKRNLSSI